MNKTKYKSDCNISPLAVDTDGLCALLGTGRATAIQIATEARARIDLGESRLVRYNVEKIREYLYESSY